MSEPAPAEPAPAEPAPAEPARAEPARATPAPSPAPGGVDFLAHQRGDDVAVAVRDTAPGPASAAYLDSGDRFEIAARDAVPLGHKVALRDLAGQENVLEYGVPIGRTRAPVAAGQLVHTHNLRSARWQKSV